MIQILPQAVTLKTGALMSVAGAEDRRVTLRSSP